MKRSPIVNPITDATYEQPTDPALQGYIPNGSTWYDTEAGSWWFRYNGQWDYLNDDEDLKVGELWHNQADNQTYRWNGGNWELVQQLQF